MRSREEQKARDVINMFSGENIPIEVTKKHVTNALFLVISASSRNRLVEDNMEFWITVHALANNILNKTT